MVLSAGCLLHKSWGTELREGSARARVYLTEHLFSAETCRAIFEVTAEPFSSGYFPRLLLTKYLRPTCDSSTKVFAFNFFPLTTAAREHRACQDSAVSPNYNSVIFAIELKRNSYAWGSANENWDWNPIMAVGVCPSQTQLLTYSLGPAREGLTAQQRSGAHPPFSQPAVPAKCRCFNLWPPAL